LFTTKKKKKSENSNGMLGETFRSDALPANIEKSEPEQEEGEYATETAEATEPEAQKTAFSIRAFPVGGYVSMAGEDERSTDKNAFCNKPVWQRFIITVAGAAMNILLGFLCMCTLVGIESVDSGALASNVVAGFQENSVSDKCEEPLMVGDRIIKVDGVYVFTGNEAVYEIMNSGNKPIDIEVIRGGKKITLNDVVFPTQEESGVTFGSYDFKVKGEAPNFVNVVKHSVFRSFSTIKLVFDSIKDLITGRYGADAVSGPIGMAGAVGEAAGIGFSSLLYLFTLITMNLGVFNLLPLPALDGGRIIFLIIEGVFRKPVKKEIEGAINAAGLLLLLAIMLLVTLKDVINLF
jgi:regulator of sigma E protease